MTPLALAAYAVVCVVWSTTWFAIRVSNRGFPPLLGGGIRLLAAALILAAVIALLRLRPRVEGTRARIALALAGVLNAVNYAAVYWAALKVPGGMSAVAAATHPFFAALIASAAGLERLRLARMAGLLVGLAGVAALSYDSLRLHRLDALVVLLLDAAIVWPCYGALLKRYVTAPHPLRVSAWFLGTGGALMLTAALAQGQRPIALTPGPLLAVAYLVVLGSVVAWSLFFYLLPRISLSALAAMTFVQPVIALAVDAVAGEELLSPRAYGGAALVVTGLVVALGTERQVRVVGRESKGTGEDSV